MTDKILIVEDQTKWKDILKGHLRNYELYIVGNCGDAKKILLDHQDIQLAIVNINLEEREPGYPNDQQGLDILEMIQNEHPSLPRVVLTGEPQNLNRPIEIFVPLGVNEVFLKALIHDKRGFLDIVKRYITSPIPERERISMNWETVITAVVSAVAVNIAKSTSGEVGKLWEWIRKKIKTDGSLQDKKILDNFQQEPVEYQNELTDTLSKLVTTEDIVNLIQELFTLLNDPACIMFEKLPSICSALDVNWRSETGPAANQELMANWAVRFARANKREKELIDAIIQANPRIFSR